MATDDELAQAVTAWADDARLEKARRRREAQHWSEQVAAESSTFAGLLLDLYETATVMQLHSAHGRIHGGMITEIGVDFITLASPGQARVMLALDAIGSIQISVSAKSLGAISDRTLSGVSLAEVLTQLVIDRSRVRFITRTSPQARTGILIAAGVDMATVALDSPNATVFIPFDQFVEISFV